jgi:hypothetical protein
MIAPDRSTFACRPRVSLLIQVKGAALRAAPAAPRACGARPPRGGNPFSDWAMRLAVPPWLSSADVRPPAGAAAAGAAGRARPPFASARRGAGT